MRRIFNIENSARVIAIGLFFAAILLPHWQQPLQDMDRFERIAAALEAYAVDNDGKYPPHKNPDDPRINGWYLPNILTTPIPYLTGVELKDPLSIETEGFYRYTYINVLDRYSGTQSFLYPEVFDRFGAWIIVSPGYDKVYERLQFSNLFFREFNLYDATNGTLSKGDMLRSQRMTSEVGIRE